MASYVQETNGGSVVRRTSRRGRPSPTAGKLRSSCDRCTALKIRCDKQRPTCERCRLAAGRPACVYSPYRWKGRPATHNNNNSKEDSGAIDPTETELPPANDGGALSTLLEDDAPFDDALCDVDLATSPWHLDLHLSTAPSSHEIILSQSQSCNAPRRHPRIASSTSTTPTHPWSSAESTSWEPVSVSVDSDMSSGVSSTLPPNKSATTAIAQGCLAMALSIFDTLRLVPSKQPCRYQTADANRAVYEPSRSSAIAHIPTGQALKSARSAVQTLGQILSRQCTTCATDGGLGCLLFTIGSDILGIYWAVFEGVRQPSHHDHHENGVAGEENNSIFAPMQLFGGFNVDTVTSQRLNAQLVVHELKGFSKFLGKLEEREEVIAAQGNSAIATTGFGIRVALHRHLSRSLADLMAEIDRFCRG
ncbi:hypothetical protein F4818DRAFT_170045 [Hypoxylon cercidicola]|nr:hypothetical protein F4818DRAFT_170045 [Hypoxylon cercidicola]